MPTTLAPESTKHEGLQPRASERHAVGCCEEMGGCGDFRFGYSGAAETHYADSSDGPRGNMLPCWIPCRRPTASVILAALPFAEAGRQKGEACFPAARRVPHLAMPVPWISAALHGPFVPGAPRAPTCFPLPRSARLPDGSSAELPLVFVHLRGRRSVANDLLGRCA
jgi:hypothetical protein